MVVPRGRMQVERFYRETMHVYDQRAVQMARDAKEDLLGRDLPQEDVQVFLKACRRGARVLDLGCGVGRDLRLLADRGLRMTGVDFSSGTLAQARRLAPDADLLRMDMRSLFFRDGTFDAAWCSASFCELATKKDVSKVFREIVRVLKPSGALYVLACLNHDGNPLHFTEEFMISSFRSAGVTPLQGFPFGDRESGTVKHFGVFGIKGKACKCTVTAELADYLDDIREKYAQKQPH